MATRAWFVLALAAAVTTAAAQAVGAWDLARGPDAQPDLEVRWRRDGATPLEQRWRLAAGSRHVELVAPGALVEDLLAWLTVATEVTLELPAVPARGLEARPFGYPVAGFAAAWATLACPDASEEAGPPDDPLDDATPRFGDWWLVDGSRLVARAGDGALIVACAADGLDVAVTVAFRGLQADTASVAFEAPGHARVESAAQPVIDHALTLTVASDDPLIELLRTVDLLTIRLTPSGPTGAPITFQLPTVAFAEALPWLGCGPSDACPVRSCGR